MYNCITLLIDNTFYDIKLLILCGQLFGQNLSTNVFGILLYYRSQFRGFLNLAIQKKPKEIKINTFPKIKNKKQIVLVLGENKLYLLSLQLMQ